ncbi:hypothetical protein TrVFT333_004281 [Trichoderma virens FT-333]|nr:hypothetical protein TrVFT333_004281 [Trichoderma virens FT-333]
MLPLQAIDGPAVLPPPDQSSALAIAEVGENRNQKPKTLPCKYCSKRFRRVEHVQRHERTHTKEKPFSCGWDRCGKTFGRRDLLVRHEKLVHLNEGHKDASRPRKLSGTSLHKPSLSDSHVELDVMGIHRLRPPPPPPPTTTTLLPPQPSPPQQQQQQHQHQHQPQAPPPPYHHGPMGSDAGSHLGQQDPQAAARTAACNLDLLSDAALASEVNTMQPLLNGIPQQPPTHSRVKSYPDTIEGYAERARADPPILAAGFGPQPQQPAYEDYNLFLDDYTTPQHFLPPHFEPDQQMNFLLDLRPCFSVAAQSRVHNSPLASGLLPLISPNTPQSRLETIQAVLLLFSVGLWGAKTILNEALSLQSTLAILIREEGLTEDISQASVTDWDAWIKREGATRTKLIAYSFFNLCSIAYDLPPLLVTSELRLSLPLPARLWRAETAWQWQELRQSTPMVEITVHEAIARLFGRTNQGLPNHLSSLGFYVLIHVLIQHVYFLKQTSLAAGLPFETQRTLKPEDVEEVTQALRVWHTTVEQHHYLLATGSGPFASTDFSPGGLLAYNATALLRLAYIRLYSDTPPSRELQTRDSMLMASAMISTPLVVRSVRLHGAVFQAVHALSMLVKAGVNYVARTKSTEWSIQHSLCNFECALLLAKWLLTLASLTPSDAPISLDERNLLETVRRMLDETEFAVPVDPSLSGANANPQMETATTDPMKLRQLASAVVRLWAETFKGTHIFDMIKTMGASLDGYADLVDKPRDRVALAPTASIN